MKHAAFTLVAAAVIAASGAAARAGQMTLGEFEYMNSCAQCHGADGRGAGPVSAYLTQVPSDLTGLARRNEGIFPVEYTRAVIAGTADVPVHGAREMPMWGPRYVERMLADIEQTGSVRDAQAYANTRILALVEYLISIQSP